MDELFKNTDKKALLTSASHLTKLGEKIVVATLKCEAKYSMTSCCACYENIFCGQNQYYCECQQPNIICHKCFEGRRSYGNGCYNKDVSRHNYTRYSKAGGTRFCDGCRAQPYPEDMYHCTICKDFDFCFCCYSKKANHEHSLDQFKKIPSIVSYNDLSQEFKKMVNPDVFCHDENVVLDMYNRTLKFLDKVDKFMIFIDQSKSDQLVAELIYVGESD